MTCLGSPDAIPTRANFTGSESIGNVRGVQRVQRAEGFERNSKFCRGLRRGSHWGGRCRRGGGRFACTKGDRAGGPSLGWTLPLRLAVRYTHHSATSDHACTIERELPCPCREALSSLSSC